MKKIIPILVILFLLVGTVFAYTLNEDLNIFGNLYVMGSITAMLPSTFVEIMTEHIYIYHLHQALGSKVFPVHRKGAGVRFLFSSV